MELPRQCLKRSCQSWTWFSVFLRVPHHGPLYQTPCSVSKDIHGRQALFSFSPSQHFVYLRFAAYTYIHTLTSISNRKKHRCLFSIQIISSQWVGGHKPDKQAPDRPPIRGPTFQDVGVYRLRVEWCNVVQLVVVMLIVKYLLASHRRLWQGRW